MIKSEKGHVEAEGKFKEIAADFAVAIAACVNDYLKRTKCSDERRDNVASVYVGHILSKTIKALDINGIHISPIDIAMCTIILISDHDNE
jgi:hypothetical protein